MKKQKEDLAKIQMMANSIKQQPNQANEIIDSQSTGIIQYKNGNKSIKIIKKIIQNENLQPIFMQYDISKKLHHLNILKTFGLFFGDDKSPSSILLEYCPNNLDEAIKKKKLSKVQRVYSIYQIAEFMKYVHSCSNAHINLSPSSIFIAEDGTIKICIFNISNSIEFVAPEIKDGKQFDEKADVFSFGTIVFFILSEGQLPGSNDLTHFSLLAQQLLEACFEAEPSNRPNFALICQILEENKFNLASLSEKEIQEISEMIRNYKTRILGDL